MSSAATLRSDRPNERDAAATWTGVALRDPASPSDAPASAADRRDIQRTNSSGLGQIAGSTTWRLAVLVRTDEVWNRAQDAIDWCARTKPRAKAAMGALGEGLERRCSRRRRRRLVARLGPAFLVTIFVEDGVRIWWRWNEQMVYLTSVMRMRRAVGFACLVLSSVVQLVASALVLRPRHLGPSRVVPACISLIVFVVVQPALYGQSNDADFVCQSVTLIGGLLLLVWSENHHAWRVSSLVGVPLDLQGVGADRLQLAGRLGLTFLFFFQALCAENGGLHSVWCAPTVWSALLVALLLGLTLLVSVGFKTEPAALGLTALFGLSNIWMHPFWNVPERLADFYKYYFFHSLSIMGGLLLLSVHGPGGISVDERLREKKWL